MKLDDATRDRIKDLPAWASQYLWFLEGKVEGLTEANSLLTKQLDEPRKVAPRTADEDTPRDRPILVWVADLCAKTNKPMGWRMGRCVKFTDGDYELLGDNMHGDWKITHWHPLPKKLATVSRQP